MRQAFKKVSGAVDYMDLIGAGLVKYFAERALTPVVGNGTLKSGAIKLGAGAGIRRFMGKGLIPDSLSLGLSIDGIEDLLLALIGGKAGLGGAGSSDW